MTYSVFPQYLRPNGCNFTNLYIRIDIYVGVVIRQLLTYARISLLFILLLNVKMLTIVPILIFMRTYAILIRVQNVFSLFSKSLYLRMCDSFSSYIKQELSLKKIIGGD